MLAQVLVNGLVLGAIYSLLALGLAVTFGVLKVVNFAHGQFVTLGMLAAYFAYTRFGIHPALLAVLSIPLFLAVGWSIERGLIERTLGREEDIQIVLTVGLAATIQGACTFLIKPAYRTINVPGLSEVFRLGDVGITRGKLLAVVGTAASTFIIVSVLHSTRLGLRMRAAADSPLGALLVGIPLPSVRANTFALGTATASLAGALIVPFLQVSPEVGADFTLHAFVIVVFAGMGRIAAAVAAGLAIGVIESLSAFWLQDSLKAVPVLVLFIAVLCLRARGDQDPDLEVTRGFYSEGRQ